MRGNSLFKREPGSSQMWEIHLLTSHCKVFNLSVAAAPAASFELSECHACTTKGDDIQWRFRVRVCGVSSFSILKHKLILLINFPIVVAAPAVAAKREPQPQLQLQLQSTSVVPSQLHQILLVLLHFLALLLHLAFLLSTLVICSLRCCFFFLGCRLRLRLS